MKANNKIYIIILLFSAISTSNCNLFSKDKNPLTSGNTSDEIDKGNGIFFNISGTVSGAVVSDVNVILSGASSASTVTNHSGNYTFFDLRNGTYIITPSLAGFTFNPSSITVTVGDANVTSKNFTATKKTRLVCGHTITEDTILNEDLICDLDAQYAIVIGASNVTLDLGGHTISGYAPTGRIDGTGVFAQGVEGITIRNGTIEGFNDGIFISKTDRVTIENLTVKNQNINDPNHTIFGVHISSSQNIVVKDMLFEFPSVAHKESVEIFNSNDVNVSNIKVHGGGVGVNFSFAQICDPAQCSNNGTVLNSSFSGVYIAGILVSCGNSITIAGNNISSAPSVGIGIQGDAPFLGAVTGLIVKRNIIHNNVIGIEFRGITKSTISNNIVRDNSLWGIALRQSLGCLASEPGWECVYSTDNTVINNKTSRNGIDLYHYKKSVGNIWKRNTYKTKEGSDIP